jgi:hypothetical protein
MYFTRAGKEMVQNETEIFIKKFQIKLNIKIVFYQTFLWVFDGREKSFINILRSRKNFQIIAQFFFVRESQSIVTSDF